MSSHKQTRALSAQSSTNNASQLGPEERKGRRTREKRCESVKNPLQVVSFEGSKASSVRKQKQKNKKKAILAVSEHETPVLGKYFLANSNQPKLSPRGEVNSVKAPPSINPQLSSSAAEEVEARLDQTIDRLRSKQQTI